MARQFCPVHDNARVTRSESHALHQVAGECVGLVSNQFGVTLDWTPESLTELDAVCASLLADGPLTGPRLDLWWKLVGAYTGEVVIRAYGGGVDHPRSSTRSIRHLGSGHHRIPFQPGAPDPHWRAVQEPRLICAHLARAGRAVAALSWGSAVSAPRSGLGAINPDVSAA